MTTSDSITAINTAIMVNMGCWVSAHLSILLPNHNPNKITAIIWKASPEYLRYSCVGFGFLLFGFG